MAVLPPPGPGCVSCAARDAVIGEQARVLEEQAAAIGELRVDVVALAAEVADLWRWLGRNSGNSSMVLSAVDLGVAVSHQIADSPLETAPVTQHDLHEVACRCGRVPRAAAPVGAGAA